jgi:hypothetical protein
LSKKFQKIYFKQSFNFAYRSMYIGAGQGVGFGFPLLLGIPAYDLSCTPDDYVDVIDQGSIL